MPAACCAMRRVYGTAILWRLARWPFMQNLHWVSIYHRWCHVHHHDAPTTAPTRRSNHLLLKAALYPFPSLPAARSQVQKDAELDELRASLQAAAVAMLGSAASVDMMRGHLYR